MDKYQEILDSCDERMNSSLSNFGDNLKKIRTGERTQQCLMELWLITMGI